MALLPNNHASGLFVRAPMEAVHRCFERWRNESQPGVVVNTTMSNDGLERGWAHVAERVFSPCAAFFIPVATHWTGFFNNQLYEFLPQAELYVFCKHLRTDTCFVSRSDRTIQFYYNRS